MKDLEGKGEDNQMDENITGGKNWMDNLKGPTLDYNGVFDEDTGIDPGLTVWQIDNFYPVLQDDTLHGKFYTGDCYIILHSIVENHDLKHQIYFWIGQESSLDKKACAAMHAVNLRNMLNAKTRTSRQGTDQMTNLNEQMFDSTRSSRNLFDLFRLLPNITQYLENILDLLINADLQNSQKIFRELETCFCTKMFARCRFVPMWEIHKKLKILSEKRNE